MENFGEIKAISLDLWGTLIMANPAFKEHRTDLLQTYCNKDRATIQGVWDGVKAEFDNRAKHLGEGFTSDFMFQVVCHRLGLPLAPSRLLEDYYELFRAYPPQPNEDGLTDTLAALTTRYSLHLVSNTMFAAGKLLREIFTNKGTDFEAHFTSFTFSDEVGFSKPSPVIFENAFRHMSVEKRQVLHIGDDALTDYAGASSFGFKSLLLANGGDPVGVAKAASIAAAAKMLLD